MPKVKQTAIFLLLAASAGRAELRLGIIGTDTSHVPAFTKILNEDTSPDHVPGGKVVAAYKGGSKDLEASYSRVDKYAQELRSKWHVEIVPDIPTLCRKVDAVLLESVDGRVHLEQVKPVIAAHKPVFIDKPLAATLEDVREIARLAKEAGVPWFSASSLRYGEIGTTMKFRDATGVSTWGPGPYEEHHALDLAYYAIHPIELLYTLMGPGCEEVTRTYTPNADLVVGRWKDGRIGTVRAAAALQPLRSCRVPPEGDRAEQPEGDRGLPSATGGNYEVLRNQATAGPQRGNPRDVRVYGCRATQ